jgi:hypothetical protein
MEVQEAYNMTKLTFLRAAATRWLSHGRACSRLLDRYEPIIDAIDSILTKSRSPEVVGLREMLLNKHTIAAAASLCDMLKPIVIFSDYLQGDVHFSHVNEKMRVSISTKICLSLLSTTAKSSHKFDYHSDLTIDVHIYLSHN